jgi:hypothetical protein
LPDSGCSFDDSGCLPDDTVYSLHDTECSLPDREERHSDSDYASPCRENHSPDTD